MNRVLLALVIMIGSSSSLYGQDIYGGRNRPKDLIRACGAKGLAVDFVTGNCVAPRGRQINPHNLYSPFTAPLPQPNPNELLRRCGAQGRTADFATGRCM